MYVYNFLKALLLIAFMSVASLSNAENSPQKSASQTPPSILSVLSKLEVLSDQSVSPNLKQFYRTRLHIKDQSIDVLMHKDGLFMIQHFNLERSKWFDGSLAQNNISLPEEASLTEKITEFNNKIKEAKKVNKDLSYFLLGEKEKSPAFDGFYQMQFNKSNFLLSSDGKTSITTDRITKFSPKDSAALKPLITNALADTVEERKQSEALAAKRRAEFIKKETELRNSILTMINSENYDEETRAIFDKRNVQPILVVGARYPLRAAQDGAIGWVKVSFSINQYGAIEDVAVIDSSTLSSAMRFKSAAKEAIKKWQFKQQTIKQTGLAATFTFLLE